MTQLRIAAALGLAALTGGAGAADIVMAVKAAGGGPAADAVVVAEPLSGKALAMKVLRTEIIAQVDFEFVPRVKAVYLGAAVHFPNKDNGRHHVYSFSPAKRFELSLYAGTAAPAVLFDRPGVVVLGCNIHDWMIGWVYVSPSPYHAVTGDDGVARLANLPSGAYRVTVWHPQLEGSEEATRRQVSVGASGNVDLTAEITLRPEVRVPRRAFKGKPAGG
jgi:plastocyanin